MLSIVQSPNWDFVGKKTIAAIGSASLILVGMISLFARGDENLDIDFRGGTMVTFEFVEPQPLDDVRADLEKQFESSITLERLTLSDEQQGTGPGRRYRLRTTEEDVETVRHKVAEAFPSRELLRVTMDFGEILPIAESDPSKPDAPSGQKLTGYEGGHQATLTFSAELTVTVIADELRNAIAALDKDYPEPEALFQLTGSKGEGLLADEHQVRKFSEMQLSARPGLAQADIDGALNALKAQMAATPLFEEVNKFAKSVGGEMQEAALLAILISLIAIIAYIWVRFQRITFGLAAVAALVHDVLVVAGLVAIASFASGTSVGALFALVDFKINLPMIAAFLTIIGYSLNDTIVVFDRIREVRGKNPALTVEMVNTSLNQTLSRTLLTSVTTFIVVSILYFMGGSGIHGFAFCLVMGVIVGTYSSVYVASPVLLWLMNRPSGSQQSARSKAATTV